MALDLMPVSPEAPRCSEFARSIDVLPPGSGLFLDRVILVSVPLPWPKPALKHEALASLAPVVMDSAVKSRLFAMEPTGAGFGLEVYERAGATTERHRWQATSAHELAALIEAIAASPGGGLSGVAPGHEVSAEVAPTFLICTQGSHDTCCGTSGVALADELEATRPDYVVRRVSHTGGHRFSPTFLAFPEGRMWAFADGDLVDRVATDTITADDVIHHARGWWGAPVGPAQVAECAVRAERVGQPFVEPQIVPDSGDDDASAQPASGFTVTSGGAVWQVQVRVERAVPSIACETPGGLPAKPGREFGWSIERG